MSNEDRGAVDHTSDAAGVVDRLAVTARVEKWERDNEAFDGPVMLANSVDAENKEVAAAVGTGGKDAGDTVAAVAAVAAAEEVVSALSEEYKTPDELARVVPGANTNRNSSRNSSTVKLRDN
jgi:hypothetical protein